MSKSVRAGIAAGAFALAIAALSVSAAAQDQVPLVIRGGTLIDGNGGNPVNNSVVVIEGNQITAAGTAGAVAVPNGAEIIDASGKWIVPGLWDGQVNYSWFWGELFLHHGVTSLIDIGLGGEVSIAARDAVNAGLQRGPREWIGVAHFGGFGADELNGYETPFDGRQLPATFAEVQSATNTLLDAGADMLMFHSGAWDPEWVRWACEEAHNRGKPCFQRAGGPRMGPREAALAGADVFHHSTGVGAAVARDGFTSNNELERYANMDEAKARDLISLLVREQVYLVPNIIHVAPGYPEAWPQMQEAYEELFSNPALLAYYDPAFLARLRGTREGVDRGEVRERRMPGYQNMIRFHRMFIESGGKALIGGDTNGAKVPGSIVHEEMAIWQEGGIPQMQIIQAATLWPAEAMRVSDRIGTVDAGKLADIVIVNADPLEDISNLRDIDTVIQNGKAVDREFHASYSTPFGGQDTDQRYTINNGQWVATVKAAFGGRGAQAPDPSESPQPAIERIAPTMTVQGDPVTLTLDGFNFVQRSRVYVDGVSVPYRWLSPTELEVTLDENLVARAGRFPIVVRNPEPVANPVWGDGVSNTAYLIVKYR